jgi:sec-independent protein translocase protein TatB
MFDVGFSELVVIGIVALVVIGPERLPRVARTAGVLFGRLQRYVAQVKSDIGREIEMADLQKAKSEFEGAARAFKSDLETHGAEVEREIRDAQAQIERDLSAKSEPTPVAAPAEAPPPPQPAMLRDERVDPPPPEPSPQLELDIGEGHVDSRAGETRR